jgi:hypothetical protein
VSPTNHNLIQLTGRYAECPACHVPNCDPVPPRYPLTVRGPSSDCEITPHLPTCLYLCKVREGAEA